MHAIAHGGVRTHVRESALKVDSGGKDPLPVPLDHGTASVRQSHKFVTDLDQRPGKISVSMPDWLRS